MIYAVETNLGGRKSASMKSRGLKSQKLVSKFVSVLNGYTLRGGIPNPNSNNLKVSRFL